MATRSLPGTRDQRLAVLILVWTLAIWIPRLFIIPVSDTWELLRVVGSIVLGAAAAFAAWKPNRYDTAILGMFAVWSVGVWARSLWNYWTLDNPLDLRLVHTVLALGFFYLAWRAARLVTTRTSLRGDPARFVEG